MKQFIALLATTLGLAAACQPAAAQQNDFRHHHWGEAMDSVAAQEPPWKALAGHNGVFYEADALAGQDCEVSFGFNEDQKLSSGSYSFVKQYADERLLLLDYQSFARLLAEKYGPPQQAITTDATHWIHGPEAALHQRLQQGKFAPWQTSWSTPRTNIHLVLNPTGQGRLSMYILYAASDNQQLLDLHALQQALPKL